jgi:hypothetical protein
MLTPCSWFAIRYLTEPGGLGKPKSLRGQDLYRFALRFYRQSNRGTRGGMAKMARNLRIVPVSRL